MKKDSVFGFISVWILVAFLCPKVVRADSGYLTDLDAREVEIDLEADVEPSIYQVGYIEGMADAYSGTLICPLPRTTRIQLVEFVEDYIRERPDSLVKSPKEIILTALRAALPCRKTK